MARGAVLRLTIRQDTAALCEGSDALMAGLPAAGLLPGAAAEWGLYALLQAVDLGFAGKIHLFGPKAALSWPFHVEVTAADPLSGEEGSPTVFRATVRWCSPGDEGSGIEVELDG
ncbi:MAG: hypothetical protein HZB55_05530 [Deltaproteobacteria bacterium]|nr:hypothetical protein [Deltaproteobacteria bacterium]